MTIKRDAVDSSMQLQQNLLASVGAALATPRPILVHLNADTTWLLQLPYPPAFTKPAGRSRFNILIDPWLRGRQFDVAAWFSSQWHSVDASMQTIAEINLLLESNESQVREHTGPKTESPQRSVNYIDAVVVSHEFTDHCHRQTLLEVDPATPVFATSRAARLIRSWTHFDNVLETPPFSFQNANWRSSSLAILPDWLGISRVVSESDALYYHSAILVTFDLGQSNGGSNETSPNTAEAVIYTPHGIHAQDLRCLAVADPAVTVLALLHGLHDIKISVKQLNLGAHNGLQAQRLCNAKYWVSTHDEVKRARGFITPMLHRKILTLKEALEEERRQTRGQISTGSELAGTADVTFADLKSGESLLLL